MLGVLGLTMVGTLSGDSITKGLAASCIGVLVATIGFSPQGAVSRFDFGITYLMDQGLPIVPVVLGLFAIPETMALAVSNSSISSVPQSDVRSGLITGIRDSFREWWLVLRSTLIGVYIGILPGMGGSVCDWVAYGHAVQSAKDKSRFGKGDVRGVIAPQAAENAVKGGALIPTIAFGIPGSTGMALLLGAFLIQGLTPGPQMLTTKLDITFSLMWTLVIANIIGAAIMMIWTKQLSKIVFVDGSLIVPAIVLFLFMGAWMANAAMGDWYLMLVFGAVGLAMRYGGWPRAPLILGFILGSIMETALNISLQSYGFEWLYARPVTAAIGALALLTVILTVLGVRKRRRDPNRVTIHAEIVGSDAEKEVQKFVSLPLALTFLVILAVAITKAVDWPYNVGLFPLTFAYPAVVLVAIVVVAEIAAIRHVEGGGRAGVVARYADVLRDAGMLRGILGMFIWFAAIVGGTYIAGQLIVLPLFIAAFLLTRGYRWYVAAIYAFCGWAVLYGLFDLVADVAWYPSLILDI
jgi:TctA family transporter